MKHALLPHPDAQPKASITIEASVDYAENGLLTLGYRVTGETQSLRLPASEKIERADDLWRSTCFETFIRAPSSNVYYEFNFAPSRRWAAYRFDCYRDGMSIAHNIEAPEIKVHAAPGAFQLTVKLSLAGIAELTAAAAWDMGLATVIEERAGGLSYWALKHAPGKPDFHHSDCFVRQMPPASRP